jgi:DNA-binding CsgD family transcriptional regulator
MPRDLSPREREALDHIASGRTTKEIAAALSIKESTVNWHVSNARSKLGASTRAEAVAIALRDNSLDRTEVMRRPRRELRSRSRAFVVAALCALLVAVGAGTVAGAFSGGATPSVALPPIVIPVLPPLPTGLPLR